MIAGLVELIWRHPQRAAVRPRTEGETTSVDDLMLYHILGAILFRHPLSIDFLFHDPLTSLQSPRYRI